MSSSSNSGKGSPSTKSAGEKKTPGDSGRQPYLDLEKDCIRTGKAIRRTRRRADKHVREVISEKLQKELEDIS